MKRLHGMSVLTPGKAILNTFGLLRKCDCTYFLSFHTPALCPGRQPGQRGAEKGEKGLKLIFLV